MANFPAGASSVDQNKQVANDSSMVITKPSGNTFVEQQWRNVIARGDHKVHALSLNRDSSLVTTNPWP